MLVFLKNAYVNRFAGYLEQSGYITTFRIITFGNKYVVVGIFSLLILILLSYQRTRAKSSYIFSLLVFSSFIFLGFLYLAMDLFEVLSFVYFILYGALVSLVFGLRFLKLKPTWMDERGIQSHIRLEMIKISLSNLWRGLTIFTTIIIAIFISALVSWVLTPPPEHFKIIADITLKQSFLLFLFALPGIGYTYLRIFKQINQLEKLILEL